MIRRGLNIVYDVLPEGLLLCNELCETHGKNFTQIFFGILEKFYDDIIFFGGFVNKFYLAFQGIDDMQYGNLPGWPGKFVSAVFAPGALYYSGLSKPVEYLFQKLVWNIAAQGDIFYLQEAGVVKFRKSQKCCNAIPAFTAYCKHRVFYPVPGFIRIC